jgi:hypothetical protein
VVRRLEYHIYFHNDYWYIDDDEDPTGGAVVDWWARVSVASLVREAAPPDPWTVAHPYNEGDGSPLGKHAGWVRGAQDRASPNFMGPPVSG